MTKNFWDYQRESGSLSKPEPKPAHVIKVDPKSHRAVARPHDHNPGGKRVHKNVRPKRHAGRSR
jgi:hypothetical protein